jgi:uncharacterized sulfatase
MIRWPGKAPASRSDRLATSLDIFPTALAAAGIRLPAKLPGVNLLDAKSVNARRAVYGACFTHDAVELRNPAANVLSRWVVDGDWKLIAPVAGREGEDVPPDRLQLYHVAIDPLETNNLADKETPRVEALRRKLDAWWKP